MGLYDNDQRQWRILNTQFAGDTIKVTDQYGLYIKNFSLPQVMAAFVAAEVIYALTRDRQLWHVMIRSGARRRIGIVNEVIQDQAHAQHLLLDYARYALKLPLESLAQPEAAPLKETQNPHKGTYSALNSIRPSILTPPLPKSDRSGSARATPPSKLPQPDIQANPKPGESAPAVEPTLSNIHSRRWQAQAALLNRSIESINLAAIAHKVVHERKSSN